jgi:glycine/serine hydroxymethyltransferase
MAAENAEQWTGRDPLAELDPAVKEIIGKEKNRQVTGLELIASEVSWILYECTMQTHCETTKQLF